MAKMIGVVVSLLIVLAGAAAAQQPSVEPRRDVLILRAGGLQEGELQGCSGATCSFGGRSHSRAEILMLGLAVTANDAPPAIADPFQDAVYLRNAGVVKSKLVSIDARQVVAEQGPQPRANVVWVFLALAPASPGPGGALPPPPAAGQTGALWTGKVQWTHKPAWSHLITTSADVRLREKPVVVAVPRGSFVKGMADFIKLQHEGSQVQRRHEPVLGNTCAIAGEGRSPATGEMGEIYRTLEDVGRNGEQRWSRWVYHFSVVPDRDPVWQETCMYATGPSITKGGGDRGGWAANAGAGDDPVKPRPLDGGRMVGVYVNPEGTSVSWNLTRQSGAGSGRQ